MWVACENGKRHARNDRMALVVRGRAKLRLGWARAQSSMRPSYPVFKGPATL